MNSADSSWTQFLQVIEDLIGECEDHMYEHDYALYEICYSVFILPGLAVKKLPAI